MYGVQVLLSMCSNLAQWAKVELSSSTVLYTGPRYKRRGAFKLSALAEHTYAFISHSLYKPERRFFRLASQTDRFPAFIGKLVAVWYCRILIGQGWCCITIEWRKCPGNHCCHETRPSTASNSGSGTHKNDFIDLCPVSLASLSATVHPYGSK